MMKPDLINVWPKDVFHTAFAKRINRNRNLFDKVITAISSGSPRHDYVQDITGAISNSIVFANNRASLNSMYITLLLSTNANLTV